MMKDKTAILGELMPNPPDRKPYKRGLAAAEGYEVIRAYRRGVTVEEMSLALGHKASPGDHALRAALGTWALRYARLSPEEDKAEGK